MSVDMNGITDAVKSILDSANTVGASPIDLSNGLTTRVQRISKINPSKIPLQASLFPLITMFYDSKSITLDTIAKNQATGRRKADITLKIVAAMWHSNFSTYDEDPSSEELEVLSENIETVLRSNSTLSNTVSWSYPTNVQYFTTQIDEQVHVRSSEIDLSLVVFY